MSISSSLRPRRLLDDQPKRISTGAEKIFLPAVRRMSKAAFDHLRQRRSRRWIMGILESLQAQPTGNGLREIDRRERENAEAMRALRRMMVALAVFALLIAALAMAAR